MASYYLLQAAFNVKKAGYLKLQYIVTLLYSAVL